MMVFFLAAASLLLLALLLIVVPYWRAKKRQQEIATDQQQMNIELTRQRLSELQRENQQGLLSDADQIEAEKELKSALVDEYQQTEATTHFHRSGWLQGIVAIVMLCIVATVYWHSNQLAKMEHWQEAIKQFPSLAKRAVMQADQSVTEQELTDLALGLRTTLQDKPDDAVAWLLLGRVYNAIGYVEPAIAAFERSLELNPEHIGAKISLSQSLVMTNQPAQLQRAKGYLQQVLAQDESDADAIGLLAIVASQLGENELAIKNWQKLLQQVPPSDPMYQSIAQRISELQPDSPESSHTADDTQTAFTLTVNVAETLRSKIPKQGFVVVFAQNAETNMKMPAAVIKQPLNQWPVTVELTDNNAMLATYKLSDLKQARLVARISLDDNVQKALGDLQGEIVLPVQAGQNVSANIMINQEVTQ
ncbi:c-type cytochrome biogenesis protein CcmI [Neptunicella sp.]|uniref:c-type cytochrome biogenesis protein CcmI n=1 Tax=Neptunicella sp. TaxID=2125986 RepID=UPI003F68C0CD